MKRILVPSDFSKPALEALKFALQVARKSKGQVFIVQAVSMPVPYESTFGVPPALFDPSMMNDVKDALEKRFEKMRKSVVGPEDKVSFDVIFGPVSGVIQQQITDKKIDLVVMGTHGTTGTVDQLVGSNAERVVRHSPVPVIALHKATSPNAIRNIVFATALDPKQGNVIRELKKLQAFFNAKLHLLVVSTPTTFQRQQETQAAMESYAKKFKLENVTLNTYNDIYEADGIINFARNLKADMIAMGTHGHWGLVHLFTGSIAEEVVNEPRITIPVWTMKQA